MFTYLEPNKLGTVDDFIEPFIRILQPVGDETVGEHFESVIQSGNGQQLGLELAYGGSTNVYKLIYLMDKYGFDNIITEMYVKEIKTIEEFEDYLNSKN